MALARFSDQEFAEAEKALLDATEIELLGLLRRSTNYTFLARLAGPDEFEALAVYKPKRGESPLWDYPDGTLYRREIAAYRLSRLLGWPDIPATVLREDGPHGVGALQLFVESEPAKHYLHGNDGPSELWQRVATFDVIANNGDRKSGHCLFEAGGRVWVVDHGLTFHVEPKLRTVIWDFAGQPLPDELRPDLQRVLPEVAGFGDLLTRTEVRALRERIEMTLAPHWRFPTPSSGWSVPWPPV